MTHVALLAMCVIVLPGYRAAASDAAVGLVIDYGDGRVTYAWIPVGDEPVSGADLLSRSGVPVVTVSFGGLGEAICQVADVGCPPAECRQRLCQTSESSSPFWQLARAGNGGWKRSSTGASARNVRAGDVVLWAWTGVAPARPIESLSSIAQRTETAERSDDNVRVITVGGSIASHVRRSVPTSSIAVLSAFWIGAGAIAIAARRRPEAA